MISVSIVGLGDGGTRNALSLQRLGARIVTGFDVQAERCQQFRRVFRGIHIATGLDELLQNSEVQLVVVATPDDQHLVPTLEALEAGKHVFVEKPLATNLSDIEKLAMLGSRYHGYLHFNERFSFANPIEALLASSAKLGRFLRGNTAYVMQECDRIMYTGSWRVSRAYNPCAGGLSHNFMTLLLLGGPIRAITAVGEVLTYHELRNHGGFDTMSGVLTLSSSATIQWLVSIALREAASPYKHRDVAHYLQFDHGALAYGSAPTNDILLSANSGTREEIAFVKEPDESSWPEYSDLLYDRMWADVIASINEPHEPRHTFRQGINVAAACSVAFESAHQGGKWYTIPPSFCEV